MFLTDIDTSLATDKTHDNPLGNITHIQTHILLYVSYLPRVTLNSWRKLFLTCHEKILMNGAAFIGKTLSKFPFINSGTTHTAKSEPHSSSRVLGTSQTHSFPLKCEQSHTWMGSRCIWIHIPLKSNLELFHRWGTWVGGWQKNSWSMNKLEGWKVFPLNAQAEFK